MELQEVGFHREKMCVGMTAYQVWIIKRLHINRL